MELINMKPHELRAIRQRLNMSQAEFGQLLFYPIKSARQRIYELEHAHKRITEIRARRAIELENDAPVSQRIQLASQVEDEIPEGQLQPGGFSCRGGESGQ